MFKIEKNVPMPTGGKYPLAEMSVGDSFAVSKAHMVGVRSMIQKLQRSTKMRWVTRTYDENIRVWRTL